MNNRDRDRAAQQVQNVDAELNDKEAVIPVVEEELRVGKREVEKGGVRITNRVTETPVQEEVRLREEHINVERRPVDRPVSSADNAFQSGTIEVTEKAEEAVVAKNARVVEEVIVNKDVQERTERVQDTVHRTDVDVQPVEGESLRRGKGSSR